MRRLRRLALAPLAMALLAGTMAQAQPATGKPRNTYVLHCAGCHAMDGSGHPDKGVPSMRGALGHFIRRPEGRAFLLQVPGVNNAGLSDAQIAEVTNWMVTQFSADTAPAGWPAYSATEVAEARRHRPLDVTRARAALVQQLRGDGIALD